MFAENCLKQIVTCIPSDKVLKSGASVETSHLVKLKVINKIIIKYFIILAFFSNVFHGISDKNSVKFSSKF